MKQIIHQNNIHPPGMSTVINLGNEIVP